MIRVAVRVRASKAAEAIGRWTVARTLSLILSLTLTLNPAQDLSWSHCTEEVDEVSLMQLARGTYEGLHRVEFG